jgi:hypothetical protein
MGYRAAAWALKEAESEPSERCRQAESGSPMPWPTPNARATATTRGKVSTLGRSILLGVPALAVV